jgi:hypothetical protein
MGSIQAFRYPTARQNCLSLAGYIPVQPEQNALSLQAASTTSTAGLPGGRSRGSSIFNWGIILQIGT